MKAYIHEQSDGHVIVTKPNYKNKKQNESEDEFLERARSNDESVNSKLRSATFKGYVDQVELPEIPKPEDVMDGKKEYFRASWRFDPGSQKIKEDLTIKNKIKWERVRSVRDQLLKLSDGDYAKATEENDIAKLNSLKTYRQELRDLPQSNQDPFAVSYPDHPTKGRLVKTDLRVERK